MIYVRTVWYSQAAAARYTGSMSFTIHFPPVLRPGLYAAIRYADCGHKIIYE